MSGRTESAFVGTGEWSEHSRTDPAMKWMEKYTKFFDTADWTNSADWYAPDFSYTKSDGTVVSGDEAAYRQIESDYAVFSKWHHAPEYYVCHESKDINGWEMIGEANLYANLVGPPDQHPKVKSPGGQEWDIKLPAAFHFWYEKSDNAKHGGIVLKRTHIMSDSGPVVVRLLQKGVLKPSDIGL